MALTLKKRAAKEKVVDDEVAENPARSKTKEKKPKGQRKIKARKCLRGSRFILFIGDEGAILLYIKNNTVISRQFVPDASEQNLEELRASLNLDTKATITLAIDSMDQTYMQQTLPPVSSMSVKKLIDRRLQRDFAPTDIKGAILLGREKSGRKDWNFLMISIERSRHISMWLDFTLLLPNRFKGIYLVAVETEIVVKDIEAAMGVPKKTGTGAEWKFFVSHNKVGGFRQVVLHNGRIIFTRMSQPIGESTPEVIAGNIEQEMQSTIEYMKRLTFSTAAGLDVYIVVSSTIQPLIDKSKFTTNTFHVMTPFEIAQYLGIEGATQPSDQFGDVILAASIATSPKHVLTLTTPEFKKFDRMFTLFRSQRFLGGLIILGLLGYSGTIASDIYTKSIDADDLEHNQSLKIRNLNDLHDEIKASNLDVEKIGDLMDQYQLLLKQCVLPFSFINRVQTVLRPPIVIRQIAWSVDDKTGEGNALAPHKMTVILYLRFPGVTEPDTFKVLSKQLMASLKGALKEFDIKFTRIPQQYTEEGLSVTFDKDVLIQKKGEPPDVVMTFTEL